MKLILSETLVQKSTAMKYHYYCQSPVYIYKEIFKDQQNNSFVKLSVRRLLSISFSKIMKRKIKVILNKSTNINQMNNHLWLTDHEVGGGLWCFTTFNNISAISWQSVLLVEETGGPGEKHRPVASHWHTLSQKRDHYIWGRKSKSWLGTGAKNVIILLSIITKSLCFWFVHGKWTWYNLMQ